ncbi:hypothetical protein ATCC90586_001143 [Pythium insidiosum]|nr:hypothetical protein ATCC90586_001143 [Pythium insidiosum]
MAIAPAHADAAALLLLGGRLKGKLFCRYERDDATLWLSAALRRLSPHELLLLRRWSELLALLRGVDARALCRVLSGVCGAHALPEWEVIDCEAASEAQLRSDLACVVTSARERLLAVYALRRRSPRIDIRLRLGGQRGDVAELVRRLRLRRSASVFTLDAAAFEGFDGVVDGHAARQIESILESGVRLRWLRLHAFVEAAASSTRRQSLLRRLFPRSADADGRRPLERLELNADMPVSQLVDVCRALIDDAAVSALALYRDDASLTDPAAERVDAAQAANHDGRDDARERWQWLASLSLSSPARHRIRRLELDLGDGLADFAAAVQQISSRGEDESTRSEDSQHLRGLRELAFKGLDANTLHRVPEILWRIRPRIEKLTIEKPHVTLHADRLARLLANCDALTELELVKVRLSCLSALVARLADRTLRIEALTFRKTRFRSSRPVLELLAALADPLSPVSRSVRSLDLEVFESNMGRNVDYEAIVRASLAALRGNPQLERCMIFIPSDEHLMSVYRPMFEQLHGTPLPRRRGPLAKHLKLAFLSAVFRNSVKTYFESSSAKIPKPRADDGKRAGLRSLHLDVSAPLAVTAALCSAFMGSTALAELTIFRSGKDIDLSSDRETFVWLTYALLGPSARHRIKRLKLELVNIDLGSLAPLLHAYEDQSCQIESLHFHKTKLQDEWSLDAFFDALHCSDHPMNLVLSDLTLSLYANKLDLEIPSRSLTRCFLALQTNRTLRRCIAVAPTVELHNSNAEAFEELSRLWQTSGHNPRQCAAFLSVAASHSQSIASLRRLDRGLLSNILAAPRKSDDATVWRLLLRIKSANDTVWGLSLSSECRFGRSIYSDPSPLVSTSCSAQGILTFRRSLQVPMAPMSLPTQPRAPDHDIVLLEEADLYYYRNPTVPPVNASSQPPLQLTASHSGADTRSQHSGASAAELQSVAFAPHQTRSKKTASVDLLPAYYGAIRPGGAIDLFGADHVGLLLNWVIIGFFNSAAPSQMRMVWRFVEQRATWQMMGADWIRADPFVVSVVASVYRLLVVGFVALFLRYMLHASWRLTVVVGLVGSHAVMLVGQLLAVFDVSRSQSCWLLWEYLVEVTEPGYEATGYGLFTTAANVGSSVMVLTKNFVIASYSPEMRDLKSDTQAVRMHVATGFFIKLGVALAVSLAVWPMLPRQKMHLKEIKALGRPNILIPIVLYAIFLALFAVALTSMLLAVSPTTACLTFAGGRGCDATK